MKKFLIPLIFGLCSCANELSNSQAAEEDAKVITVSVAEMDVDEPDSRWIYDEENDFGWKSDDVLGIFPVGKGSQLEFPVELEEGELAETVMFDGGGWAFKGGYTYSAYSPYNLLSTKGSQVRFSYAKQCRKMDGNNFDLRENMFKVAPPTSVTNGAIFFLFYNVEAFLRIELRGLPKDKTYKSLTLVAENKVIPQEKIYDIFSMKVEDKAVTIDDEVVSVSNSLKMDLMDATPADDMIVAWMAIPAIGNSYGSLYVLVEDSDDNWYKGEALDKNSSPFSIDIKRNKRITLLVKELVETDGLVGGIEDWVTDGQEYSGVAE